RRFNFSTGVMDAKPFSWAIDVSVMLNLAILDISRTGLDCETDRSGTRSSNNDAKKTCLYKPAHCSNKCLDETVLREFPSPGSDPNGFESDKPGNPNTRSDSVCSQVSQRDLRRNRARTGKERNPSARSVRFTPADSQLTRSDSEFRIASPS